jgi:hypothetical protein
MRSMLIYAFRVLFCSGNSLAALRECQHRYLDGILLYRLVLEWVHDNLRETGTVMTHAVADRGRRNVRDEEDVLDTVQANLSTSTGHFIATGRLTQRAAWRTVSENALYTFHVQRVQGL